MQKLHSLKHILEKGKTKEGQDPHVKLKDAVPRISEGAFKE